MFMLDSHLSGEQGKALAHIREAAEQANLNLFLTGGAMRDMMGGFAIRDLDFTAEGAGVKFAKAVAKTAQAEIVEVDEVRKSVELRFKGNVTASISMARSKATRARALNDIIGRVPVNHRSPALPSPCTILCATKRATTRPRGSIPAWPS